MVAALLKLISWNVMRGGNRIEQQVTELVSRNPDVIALQEVTANSIVAYRQLFTRSGYSYFSDSLRSVPDSTVLVGSRRYGVIIASKLVLSQ